MLSGSARQTVNREISRTVFLVPVERVRVVEAYAESFLAALVGKLTADVPAVKS